MKIVAHTRRPSWPRLIISPGRATLPRRTPLPIHTTDVCRQPGRRQREQRLGSGAVAGSAPRRALRPDSRRAERAHAERPRAEHFIWQSFRSPSTRTGSSSNRPSGSGTGTSSGGDGGTSHSGTASGGGGTAADASGFRRPGAISSTGALTREPIISSSAALSMAGSWRASSRRLRSGRATDRAP